MHIPWTEIEAFHNIRKHVVAYPELLGKTNVVRYQAKIKLDGTNSAVQIRKNNVFSQSRSKFITSTDDNMGFAKWVESNREAWQKVYDKLGKEVIIFGEWAGKGVQSRTAISSIGKKVFCVFGAQFLAEEDSFISDPEVLQEMIKGISDTYVLPWYGEEVSVEWLLPAEELQKTADFINGMVAEVEKCDSFVKETFGIEGLGEGIVFYPISHPGRKAFGDLCFKAKGEKHKVVNTKTPVQVDPEKAKNTEEFAALVLTDARLEQGVRAVSNGELTFDMKNVGQFIGWICKDVEKETSAELEVSGLDWKSVSKSISNRARNWFINKAKSL